MTCDVLIRGGGVAGSAAALMLARGGFSVTLFEKNREPRHKVCGEFLSPEALPLLAAHGLLPAVEAAGARPVRSAAIVAPSGACCRFDLPRPGLGLSRLRLDALLLDAAARSGASIIRGVSVERFAGSSGGFTAVGVRGEPLARGRLALDAGGRQARPGRGRGRPRGGEMIGLKAHFRSARPGDGAVELYAIPGGYCGVCAVEEDLLNVCLVIDTAALRAARDPEALFAAIRERSAPLRDRLDGAERVSGKFVAAAGLDYRLAPAPPGPVPRLGDAAGLVTPLTGDGMAMALRAAEIAARLAAACLRGETPRERYAEAWARAWNAEFAARRRWGAGVQKLLARPAAAGTVIAILAHAPAVGRFLFAKTRGGLG